MHTDFFENGLSFYCYLAESELQAYSEFHSSTEAFWKQQDQLLQDQVSALIDKYPTADHDDIVESHGWELHCKQSKFPDIHRAALVAAIYGFAEEQVDGICEIIQDSLGSRLKFKDLAGKGVTRAFSYLSKVAEFELKAMSTIAYVKNVGALRNVLAHAAGHLPMDLKAPVNLFVAQEVNLSGAPGQRAGIGADFVHDLTTKFTGFFQELDGEVQAFIKRRDSL